MIAKQRQKLIYELEIFLKKVKQLNISSKHYQFTRILKVMNLTMLQNATLQWVVTKKHLISTLKFMDPCIVILAIFI